MYQYQQRCLIDIELYNYLKPYTNTDTLKTQITLPTTKKRITNKKNQHPLASYMNANKETHS